jgi:hypothetical protein
MQGESSRFSLQLYSATMSLHRTSKLGNSMTTRVTRDVDLVTLMICSSPVSLPSEKQNCELFSEHYILKERILNSIIIHG